MSSIDATLLDFDPSKGEWEGEYRISECKRALHPTDMPMIYDYGLDPYGGCEHGCVYCRSYRNSDQSQRRVVRVRPNIPERLSKELPAVRGARICIGQSSDGYQYAERRFLITRRCLEVLRTSGNPVCVMTKSDLVARDSDILRETDTEVIMTITSLGRKESLMAEPGAPLPDARLKAMRELARDGVRTSAMVMPATAMLSGKEKELAEKLSSSDAEIVYLGGLQARQIDVEPFGKRGAIDSPQTLERIADECSSRGLRVIRIA